MSDTPIFDALRRERDYRDLPLADAIAARAADAFLTDDLLAATVAKWAGEAAS